MTQQRRARVVAGAQRHVTQRAGAPQLRQRVVFRRAARQRQQARLHSERESAETKRADKAS
jgi:hypothetical protein